MNRSLSCVFVTGGTGLIGGGVVRSLLKRGIRVQGLARSEQSATKLASIGVTPVLGNLTDTDSLHLGIKGADAVIHAAFVHDDPTNIMEAAAADKFSVSFFRDALAGSGKPLVYSSGCAVYGSVGTQSATEDTPLQTPDYLVWRPAIEAMVLACDHGIVLRPNLVYGRSGCLAVTAMIRMAITQGASRYIGDGRNAWSSVHVDDVGEAYALALEKAPPRTVLNIGNTDVTMRELAEAIGRLIGVPEKTCSIPLDEARKSNPYADRLVMNQRVDSTRARQLLSWDPSGPEMIDDIENGSYRQIFGPGRRTISSEIQH